MSGAAAAETLDERARAVLRGNDLGGYTVPAHGLYPYQWNWDSAFAAWGFGMFDLERGWREFETLLSGQWANGMVPHVIFHRENEGYFPGPAVWDSGTSPPSSGISQPPLAATFLRALHVRDPAFGRARLATLVPKLLRWHEWFHAHRCADGLILATHPWETGRDNSPDWDGALAAVDVSAVGEYRRRDTEHVDASMRPRKADYDRYLAILQASRDRRWNEGAIAAEGPFRVVDPGLTFILLRAHRDLLALVRELGLDGEPVEGWIRQIEGALPGMWNSSLGSYDAFDLRSRRFSGGVSSAAFLCWFAGVDEPRMLQRLHEVRRTGTRGLPSFDPGQAAFEAKRYWRGATWPVVNALVGIGLAEAGHGALAEDIRRETGALIEAGGFREYFDAVTGAPAGGDAFTWTAAVWLAWISPASRGGLLG